MGKYALLLVAGFTAAGAQFLFSGQQTNVKAAQEQGAYDADLLAREIGRSAYNAAVSDANARGSNIQAALAAIGAPVVSATQTAANKCANNVPVCHRREGQMQGGTYRVEASVNGGNAIEIYARGQYAYSSVGSDPGAANYGRRARLLKTYEINEMRSAGVLEVARQGKLTIQFIDSSAGYCSAIFLQRTLPGVPAALQPQPEMVYAPGKNRNGDRNVGFETILEPGTQMNFGIGVDNTCYSGGTRPNSRPDLRMDAASAIRAGAGGSAALATAMSSYQFRESDWAWVHWALDGGSLATGDPLEAPWAMVESDRTNAQRWRISFEDIHDWNLPSTDARYNDPRYSLAATKRFGYDRTGDGRGDGWPDVRQDVVRLTDPARPQDGYTVSETSGSDGFHDLLDFGSPADFSDQVIMVQIEPVTERVPA